jgi:hypothetical protein
MPVSLQKLAFESKSANAGQIAGVLFRKPRFRLGQRERMTALGLDQHISALIPSIQIPMLR